MSFGWPCSCGVYLVASPGWGCCSSARASILAGVLYTGGPRPYGYEGLGEVFVFLFFGIVAVAGSYFVQTKHLIWEAFVLAVPVGLLAAAILVVNNVRDIDTDRRAGKRTLAVRLGRERARALYDRVRLVAFLLAPVPWIAGARCGLAAAAAGCRCRSRSRSSARAHAHRRAVAQRRPGRHRACCSWPSACCSRAASWPGCSPSG